MGEGAITKYLSCLHLIYLSLVGTLTVNTMQCIHGEFLLFSISDLR